MYTGKAEMQRQGTGYYSNKQSGGATKERVVVIGT
jgi:hypothetical protein